MRDRLALVRSLIPLLWLAVPAGAQAQETQAHRTHEARRELHRNETAHRHETAHDRGAAHRAPPHHPAPAHAQALHRGAPHHSVPHHVPSRPPAVPVPVPGSTSTPAPAPVPAPAAPETPPKGSNTGLPLPRFAALRADEVNLRSGPGTRYPIQWLYKRRDLPVKIEREFDVWRLIEDEDGVKGWVHQATLVGTRTLVVSGETRMLRGQPQEDGPVVAILKPGVIGRLLACPAGGAAGSGWCRVRVKDYTGWLPRDAFFGLLPGEVLAPS